MDVGEIPYDLVDYTRNNLLVRALPRAERASLAATCRRVEMRAGDGWSLGEDALICFPETAILSLVDAGGVEIGIVGREGMSGWSILLGSGNPTLRAVVACGGDVLALPAATFTALCRNSPALRATVLRFIETLAAQMIGTIHASTQHGVAARLARRLLMLDDRCSDHSFETTHAQLAIALGVRRASVTDSLHLLEGDRLVRCTRNRIQVADRDALRKAAGSAYGVSEAVAALEPAALELPVSG
jgi:CRP-like cAMP-binding protein